MAKKTVKKLDHYMRQHPVYNASIHAIGALGLGVLLASPLFGPHPVRWGLVLIAIAVLGHLYAWQQK